MCAEYTLQVERIITRKREKRKEIDLSNIRTYTVNKKTASWSLQIKPHEADKPARLSTCQFFAECARPLPFVRTPGVPLTLHGL